MPNKTQKFQFKANVYLQELIKTVRQEFPQTAKDEEKLIDAVSRLYSPGLSENS
jgi:hypothetical protein